MVLFVIGPLVPLARQRCTLVEFAAGGLELGIPSAGIPGHVPETDIPIPRPGWQFNGMDLEP